ncbi:hypothetical protein B0T24DRAFT_18479 [Lasiosphaeria ovina]|uniref:Secreted protein n=1 Tax=Lasiosphaeria ovina TaxID=92902 RepID=A0AAE0NJB8_9PEZI|nr:hypothetical protein B0T24DRAFT_18479 [Lasiosphaeria ovina]
MLSCAFVLFTYISHFRTAHGCQPPPPTSRESPVKQTHAFKFNTKSFRDISTSSNSPKRAYLSRHQFLFTIGFHFWSQSQKHLP